MEQLRFSIPEILSLIGVTQCVYILVYMAFRSGRISRAGLPMLYFLVLALAFLSDFSARAAPELTPYYFYGQWVAWFLGPPLSVLLVIQIAQISEVPALKHFWVIFLMPLALLVSWLAVRDIEGCQALVPCQEFRDWLILSGLVAGGVSLLAIWANRGVIAALSGEKAGKERYWLILAIVIANIFLLLTMFASLSEQLAAQEMVLIRTIIGLAFVYLVNTSLFRIYPQAVRLALTGGKSSGLNKEELKIAEKIENLMRLEKVYQEPNYSRTDLARECRAPESVISRVINVYFSKSFPQLINVHRIEDAKQLLKETDAAVKIIAEEVGFNSLASFNRVFKDITGTSPTQFRKTQ